MDGIWARKSEGVGLIAAAIIIVSKISNVRAPDPPTLQTDGRHVIAIPRFASVRLIILKLDRRKLVQCKIIVD